MQYIYLILAAHFYTIDETFGFSTSLQKKCSFPQTCYGFQDNHFGTQNVKDLSQSTRRLLVSVCYNAKKSDRNEDKDESEPLKEGDSGTSSRILKIGTKMFSPTQENDTDGTDKTSDRNNKSELQDKKKQGSWFRRVIGQKNELKEETKDLVEKKESDTKDSRRFGIFNRKERMDNSSLESTKETNKVLNIDDRDQTRMENLPTSLSELDGILTALDDSLLFVKTQLEDLQKNKSSSYLWYDSANDKFLSAEQDQDRLNTLKRDLELRRKEIILLIQKRKNELELAKLEKLQRKQELKIQEIKLSQIENEKKQNVAKTFAAVSKKQQPPLFRELKGDIDVGKENKENPSKKNFPGLISSAVDGVVNVAQSGLSFALESVGIKKNENKDTEEWITVCPKTRISPGEVYPVVAGGIDLLVIGSRDGTKVYCVANSCPHLGTPLESGLIQSRPLFSPSTSISNSLSTEDDTRKSKAGFEDCIVCPLHRTEFSLETGEVRGEWCPYPPVLGSIMGQMKSKNKLPTFKMRTRGKNIEILITSKVENDDLAEDQVNK